MLSSAVFFYHLSRFAIGATAVLVFFVLSGFWIAIMWEERYSKTDAPYAVYLVSRFWRLVPAFVLVSGIAQLLEGFPDRAGSSALHYLLSQVLILGYATLAAKPIGPAWSLDIEAQFYTVAPLLIWFCSRQRSPALLLGTALLSAASGWLLGPWLPSYIVFFVVGIVAARARWYPSNRLVAMCAAAAVALIAVICASQARSLLIVGVHKGPFAHYNSWISAPLALLCAPLAIFTTRRPASRTDGMFADLSYLVYLLHWPLLKVCQSADWWGHRVLTTVLLCITTYAAAFLIWKFYDKPINQLRAAWVRKRLAAARGLP